MCTETPQSQQSIEIKVRVRVRVRVRVFRTGLMNNRVLRECSKVK